MMEYMGIRWGYTFFRTALHLPAGARFELMKNATEMYLRGVDEMEVEGDCYQGRIYTRRQYELIGEIGGMRFDAELDTNWGKDNMSFLIREPSRGMGGYASRN